MNDGVLTSEVGMNSEVLEMQTSSISRKLHLQYEMSEMEKGNDRDKIGNI